MDDLRLTILWLHDCFYWYIDVYQAGWHFSWQIFDTMAVCDGLCDVRVADKAVKFVIMSHIIWRHNFIRCNKPEERKKNEKCEIFLIWFIQNRITKTDLVLVFLDWCQTGFRLHKMSKEPWFGCKGTPICLSSDVIIRNSKFWNSKIIIKKVDLPILCFGPANRPR